LLLLGYSLVNAGFGVLAGLGLWLLGVPYPALWGLLAGLFRFVPGVGVWLVAPFPAGLAFLDSPSPAAALLVLGLFLALELVASHLVEKRACGPSIGVAPVPLLVAVMFWTGLWGVVGLVLATPITACLAVLGRHVRHLEFLAVLLGSQPALRPEARYYQRLLARDRYEAEAVVKEYLAGHTPEQLCDRVLVPALARVRRGRRLGELRPEDEAYILDATRALAAGLPAPAPALNDGGAVVLGVAPCDAAEEAALLLLQWQCRSAGLDLRLAGAGPGSSGVVARVQQEQPAVVVLASLAPAGLTEARYLCRRLRSQCRGLRVVVGRWGHRQDPRKSRKLLLSAGADQVVTTLREARRQLARLCRAPARLPDAT
jgi:hypothetical protein